MIMLMKMRKTLGIGQIVSEENTLINSVLKLRDGQHFLLEENKRKANKRETEEKKISRSCRKSMKSI